MKSIFISIFTFLSFIFIGHMLFGNSMPNIDSLVTRIESSQLDFSPIVDMYGDVTEMFEEAEQYRNFSFNMVVPSGDFFEDLLYYVESGFNYILMSIKAVGYLLYLIGYVLVWLVLDFLFILCGSFSVLFGVGA